MPNWTFLEPSVRLALAAAMPWCREYLFGRWPFWLVAVCLVLFVAGRFQMRRFKRNLRFWLPDNVSLWQGSQEALDDTATRLREEVSGYSLVSAAQAVVFAQAMISGRDIRKRIGEVYEPKRRTLRKEVKIDVEMPGNVLKLLRSSQSETSRVDTAATGRRHEEPRLYFPAITHSKG